MTVAQHEVYTYDGVTVHTIKADLAAISVVGLGSKKLVDQSYFGVNGTFFNLSTNLTSGIALQDNQSVATGAVKTAAACQTSDTPSGVQTKRGTMFCYGGGSVVAVATVKYPYEAGLGPYKWAIGGYSLFTNLSYSDKNNYYKDINGIGSECSVYAKAGTQNAFRFSPMSEFNRTAIGYDGNKIWLAVFDSCEAWTVRKFMLARGCQAAIMLDGGTSSQMKYRDSAGAAKIYDPNAGTARPVTTMVRVSPTSWI